MAREDPGTAGGPDDRHTEAVLVVDDEAEARQLLVEVIAETGCEVISAGDGDEALELFVSRQPGLVLTDLRMPGTDGLALTGAIKRLSPSTEIVIMTGYADLDAAVQAIRLGAFDFILKPFDVDTIRHRVSQALERRRLVLANAALLTKLVEVNEALRRAQAQLVEKERLAAVGEVVVTLHHAIMNPLAGILGVLALLKTDDLSPVARAEACTEAEGEIRRIEEVVRRLLALRRAASTPYVGSTTMLDLGPSPPAPDRVDIERPAPPGVPHPD